MATGSGDTEGTKTALCRQVSLIDAKDNAVEDKSYSSNVLKGLLQQFKDEKFCDVTLVFGKKEIKAHRVVLASSSQYFEAMFSSNFIDGTQQILEIPVLGESIGEALIEFAYSGKIQITSENVVDLLAGANFLQGFEFVEKSCSDFLKIHAGKHNVFQILGVADKYNQKNLKQSMQNYCIQNFVDCVDSDQEAFLNLHENLLIELMNNKELLVVQNGGVYLGRTQEEYLLKHVLDYLDHNRERKMKTAVILKCIHLPLLKKQSIQALKTNPVLKNKECLVVIEKALKLKKTKKSSTEKSRSDWVRRRPCGEYQLWKGRCLANGGYVNNVVETFDDKDEICIDKDHVTGMELWIRRWDGRPVLGGIKVQYSNGKTVMHGSNKAEQKEEFKLEPDEKIVKIDCQTGWMVDNLVFYTNRDRKVGPFGGTGGGFRHETPPGRHGYLAFIKGTVVNSQNDLGITKLQFVWRFFRLPGQKHVPDYVEPVDYHIYDDFDYDYDDEYDGYDDFLDYDDFPDDYDPDYDEWAGGWDPDDEVYAYDEDGIILPYQFEPLADPVVPQSAANGTDGGDGDDENDATSDHQSSHDDDDDDDALPNDLGNHDCDCINRDDDGGDLAHDDCDCANLGDGDEDWADNEVD